MERKKELNRKIGMSEKGDIGNSIERNLLYTTYGLLCPLTLILKGANDKDVFYHDYLVSSDGCIREKQQNQSSKQSIVFKTLFFSFLNQISFYWRENRRNRGFTS